MIFPTIVMEGNLLDGSEDALKYLVGNENIPALLAIRSALLAMSSKIHYVNIEASFDSNYVFRVGVDARLPADAEAFKNIMDAEFDPLAAPDLYIDQYIQGDRTHNRHAYVIQDDVLYGTHGNDTIIGLLGNDKIDGRDGNDDLNGGYGNDIIYGGAHDDTLYGEQNTDKLYGGTGNDYLDGGTGADYLSGGAGNDTYVVDNAADVVDDKGLASDNDVVLIPLFMSYVLPRNVEDGELIGTHDGDIAGNSGSSELDGNSGDNALSGAAGADDLYGGDGEDIISGGRGADKLAGGSGEDVFDFNTGDTGRGAARDTITDFQTDIDTLDLSGVDANSTLAEDQSFKLVSSFSNFAGQLQLKAGVLSGDVNGDGVADFQIRLLGVTSITADDLVL